MDMKTDLPTEPNRSWIFFNLHHISNDISLPKTTRITLDGLLRGKITIMLKRLRNFQNSFIKDKSIII